MTDNEVKEMGDKIISLSKSLTDELRKASEAGLNVTLCVKRQYTTTEDIITDITPVSITKKIEISLKPEENSNW